MRLGGFKKDTALCSTNVRRSNIANKLRRWLSILNPGGRRSGKAGLEDGTAVCYLVHVNCNCQRNACRHSRLGRVQRLVVV